MIVSNTGLSGAFAHSLQGIQKSSQDIARVAQNVAVNGTDNLAENLVDLKISKLAFKANVAVFRATDETSKRLLDILA